MLKNVGDALRIARRFVVWDSIGPGGDAGTFKPIEAYYEEHSKTWVVKCEFTVDGALHKVQIKIDRVSGQIKSYQKI